MSGNLTLSPQTPVVWNETTIFENGKSFLTQKKFEIDAYTLLWNSILNINENSPLLETSAERYKAIAANSKNEIKTFNQAAIELLETELASNTASIKTVQLIAITKASNLALVFFTDASENDSISALLRTASKFRMSSGSIYLSCAILATAYVSTSLVGPRNLFTAALNVLTTTTTAAIVTSISLNIINSVNNIWRVGPAAAVLRSELEKAIELMPDQPEKSSKNLD